MIIYFSPFARDYQPGLLFSLFLFFFKTGFLLAFPWAPGTKLVFFFFFKNSYLVNKETILAKE